MKKSLLLLVSLALALGFALSAWSYYSFVRAGGRTTWPDSVLTHDHTGETFQGLDLTGLNVAASPNDDTLGLLLAADATFSGINCLDGGGSFGPPLVEYLEVFNAMAAWDVLTTTTLNFAFVCAVEDITVSAFDNIVDTGSNDLEIWRNGNPVFNSVNEIVFDDTPTGEMILALNLGIPPGMLLGLALPFDSNQRIITDPAANGIIAEAFIIINQTGTPASVDVQGVVTHELGHLLGLGHTNAILNAAAGNGLLVPSMYFTTLAGFDATTLEIDDIAGITMSYPATGQPEGSFGTIQGQVFSPNGSPLTGGTIIAQDTADQEVGVIVGGEPNLISTLYRIEGVPAGTYIVRVMPLDGSPEAAFVNSSSAGQIDNIFLTPALTFAPEFFDHASDESSADSVTVTVGGFQSNINFGSASNNSGGLFGQVLPDPGGCQAAALPALGASWFWPLLGIAAFLLRRRRCQ